MGKEQREKKRKELVLELEKHQCEPLLWFEYIWIRLPEREGKFPTPGIQDCVCTRKYMCKHTLFKTNTGLCQIYMLFLFLSIIFISLSLPFFFPKYPLFLQSFLPFFLLSFTPGILSYISHAICPGLSTSFFRTLIRITEISQSLLSICSKYSPGNEPLSLDIQGKADFF